MVIPNTRYRTALALNNIGINLIQRGCYFEALKTIRESLSMIHSMFLQDNITNSTGGDSMTIMDGFQATSVPISHHGRDDPSDMFHVATKRYAVSLKRDPASAAASAAACTQTIDDDDLVLLRIALECTPDPSSMAILIRTSEPSVTNNMLDWKQLSRNFGIIHYNCGLANLLISQYVMSFNEDLEGQYVVESHRSLEIANTVFTSLISKDSNNNNTSEYSLVCLSVIVLSCLSQVYQSRDYLRMARETEQVISCLCRGIYESSIVDLLTQRHTSAAA